MLYRYFNVYKNLYQCHIIKLSYIKLTQTKLIVRNHSCYNGALCYNKDNLYKCRVYMCNITKKG